MLDELASAAAAAVGSAVVQAAGTDLWNGFRGRVAEWFGRGDAVRESRELERLDRSASELSTAGQDEVERLRVRHEAVRQSRIETGSTRFMNGTIPVVGSQRPKTRA